METASIIIAGRNYQQFLPRSIDSALAQTYPCEVVVVDDGSDDDSRAVITSYGDRVVPVFREWGGQATAMNAGVAAASGSVLFFLDCDDTADPDRVATILPMFELDAELVWVRHSMRFVDSDERLLQEDGYLLSDNSGLEGRILNDGKITGTNSGLVFCKSFFELTGPIPMAYRAYADWYLLVAAGLVGHGRTVRKALGDHRLHGAAFTAHGWSQYERAGFHLNLRKCIADDAARIAGMFTHLKQIARGETWWQLKAQAEWRKSGLGENREWHSGYFSYLAALLRSQHAGRRRLGLLVRGLFLALVPSSLFLKVWWLAHVGRPSLLGTSDRERLLSRRSTT